MCTCENCKWWIPRADGNGECDFVNNTYVDEQHITFEIFADADDDQGLICYLITGPNFGCVNWEEC